MRQNRDRKGAVLARMEGSSGPGVGGHLTVAVLIGLSTSVAQELRLNHLVPDIFARVCGERRVSLARFR